MHVLVSGAGIAGPTLAWFLAKRGACVTVLEKAKALFPHGQSVDLQGSAVTVVKRMGLLDEVRKHNTKETGTQFIDSKGTPFAPFPILEGSGASLSSEFEILRGDLAAILYRATKDLPNVEYKFDSTIRTVVKNDKSSVQVELSDGSTHEYDILVAADGQWSKVRKQCFPSEAVRAIHKGMYAVYFTVPRISSDNNMWNIYVALRSRIVALRPDSHGKNKMGGRPCILQGLKQTQERLVPCSLSCLTARYKKRSGAKLVGTTGRPNKSWYGTSSRTRDGTRKDSLTQ